MNRSLFHASLVGGLGFVALSVATISAQPTLGPAAIGNPACLTSAAGTPTAVDMDADHLLDSCEPGIGTTVGDDDSDEDGVQDGVEYGAGTNPLLNSGNYADPMGDADGDTCTNAQELGPNPVLGGDRDPNQMWDFYDVTGNKVIDLQDTLLVLAHYGHGYNGDAYQDAMDNSIDRSTPNMAKPWRSAEANDGIDTRDALASLKSFGHSCITMP